MATSLDNGIRSLQIQFASGSMTVSCIKETATANALKTFANAVGLVTNNIVTGIVISDKEKQPINM